MKEGDKAMQSEFNKDAAHAMDLIITKSSACRMRKPTEVLEGMPHCRNFWDILQILMGT